MREGVASMPIIPLNGSALFRGAWHGPETLVFAHGLFRMDISHQHGTRSSAPRVARTDEQQSSAWRYTGYHRRHHPRRGIQRGRQDTGSDIVSVGDEDVAVPWSSSSVCMSVSLARAWRLSLALVIRRPSRSRRQ